MDRPRIVGVAGREPGVRPLSERLPARKQELVRVDGDGYSNDLLNWVNAQRVQCSAGFTLPSDVGEVIELIPNKVCQPADSPERVGERRGRAHFHKLRKIGAALFSSSSR